MRLMLMLAGLLLALTGGVLYLHLGGWAFLLSTFLGFLCVVVGMSDLVTWPNSEVQ